MSNDALTGITLADEAWAIDLGLPKGTDSGTASRHFHNKISNLENALHTIMDAVWTEIQDDPIDCPEHKYLKWAYHETDRLRRL